jgi:hypothetical protein
MARARSTLLAELEDINSVMVDQDKDRVSKLKTIRAAYIYQSAFGGARFNLQWSRIEEVIEPW